MDSRDEQQQLLLVVPPPRQLEVVQPPPPPRPEYHQDHPRGVVELLQHGISPRQSFDLHLAADQQPPRQPQRQDLR